MTVAEIQSEAQTKLHAYLILTLFFFFFGLTTYLIGVEHSSFWPYLTAAISAFLMLGIVGIGHNFVHHKDNYFKYYFLLTGFSHDEWQIMHCLSHHIYPNTELDYEAAALEPLAYFLRTLPPNKVYTEAIIIFIFMFIQPLNLLFKIIIVPLLKKKKPDFWYCIPLFVFTTFYLRCGDAIFSLKLHLLIYGIFGFTMNRVLFCGHRLRELWTEGA